MKFFLYFAFLISPIFLHSNDYFSTSTEMMFGVYHSFMAPLKGNVSQCQFSPSCSEYSKQSIKQYGIAKGLLLTADRLMRCSGGHASYEDYPYFSRKFYDPPNCNSLWGENELWKLGFSDYNGGASIDEKDTVFEFAYHLFNIGELQLSKIELLRLNYYLKDSIKTGQANLLLAMNEYLSGKHLKAFDYLSAIEKIANENLKTKYFYLTYIVAENQNLNDYCINLCHQHKSVIDSVLYRKLSAYSYYKNEDLENSLLFVNHLQNEIKSDNLTLYMMNNFAYQQKSPFLAGLMSTLLPGSGYMYAGRYKEGFSALIINGLLGWGIYTLFDSGNTGSGILTSLVAFPFYLGNIVGASNAAETINQKHQQIVLSNIRNSLELNFFFSTDFLKELW